MHRYTLPDIFWIKGLEYTVEIKQHVGHNSINNRSPSGDNMPFHHIYIDILRCVIEFGGISLALPGSGMAK
jgi:hypothetical protein